jgi:hypothetical protein
VEEDCLRDVHFEGFWGRLKIDRVQSWSSIYVVRGSKRSAIHRDKIDDVYINCMKSTDILILKQLVQERQDLFFLTYRRSHIPYIFVNPKHCTAMDSHLSRPSISR